MSSSLRNRFFVLVIGIFALSAALAWYAFDRSVEVVTRELGVRFASRQVLLERERIRTPLLRELALTTRLSHSQTLIAWALNENDPALQRAGMAELEGFRQDFSDHSYFFVDNNSLHYYFNDDINQFAGHELRNTLRVGNPDDAWYFPLRTREAPYEINVDYNAAVRQTKVWINMPIHYQGRMIGLVGTGFDLSDFIARFLRTDTRGVSNVVINANGAFQLHQQAELIALNTGADEAAKQAQSSFFTELGSDTDRNAMLAAMRATARDPGSVQTLFAIQDGHERLLGVTYLPEMEWYLVTVMDVRQLIGAAPFRNILLVIGGSLLISLLLVAWALEKLVLNRVGRLDAATQRIAGGDYELRLEDRRVDELGRLSRNFERMARTVQETLGHLEARVDERTRELSSANTALATEREDSLASLRYARSIQIAILPAPATIDTLFGAHLLLWLPRDYVSGDVYFTCATPDGVYACVADCTGHGVPGALTSLVGLTVIQHVLTRATPVRRTLPEVMAEIDGALRDMLRANAGDDAPDHGMALGICRLPAGAAERVEFCGRGIDLCWLRTESGTPRIERLAGGRGGLGYRIRRRGVAHLCHTLTPAADDRLYLATDGVYDLPGGTQGYGLGRERFEAQLLATCALPLPAQGAALLDAFNAYGGERARRDDLTLFGFALAPRHLPETGR